MNKLSGMIKLILILNICVKSASLTAGTLSLRSIALTDTSYITGTVHDTVLACHLTVMNTSHIWVSSNYFTTYLAIIISTYAQPRVSKRVLDSFSIAFDQIDLTKRGLNFFKIILF